jgi:hypothetical protein
LKIYIVTYKSEQQDDIIDNVYFDLDMAKARVDHLETTIRKWNSSPGVVIRFVERPREWTEEQRIWLRGRQS